MEVPVLALAVQGGATVSKFWLQRVPVTAKEAGRVLDWLSGLVTVTFHKPEAIPVTSSDPLRVVEVAVARVAMTSFWPRRVNFTQAPLLKFAPERVTVIRPEAAESGVMETSSGGRGGAGAVPDISSE